MAGDRSWTRCVEGVGVRKCVCGGGIYEAARKRMDMVMSVEGEAEDEVVCMKLHVDLG